MAPSRKFLAALTAWASIDAARATECTGNGGQCEQTEEVALLAHRRELRKQEKLAADEGSQIKTYAGRAGVYEKLEVDPSTNVGIISGGKPLKTILEPPDNRETKMIDIINKHFEAVTGPGSFLPSNLKEDETWLACTSIDWSKYSKHDLKRGTTIFRDMEKELGIMDNCWEGAAYENDPTCKAIFALLDSVAELQAEFPEGPKYAKALVTDWGKHGSAFPGALGPVDQSSMPPRAEVIDPNGMNGYMICEIVRTILTQSTNQVGSGSCSFVASLGALEHAAPAYAIKSAVRLLWTGRHSIYAPKTCNFVFDMQPGLVPYESASGWQPANAPENIRTAGSACSGGEFDCVAAEGSPPQPMGLVFAWYQALIGAYDLSNFGSCSKPRQTTLLWPGASALEKDRVGAAVGGDNPSGLWGCKLTLDPEGGSCQMLVNMDVCDPNISDELCGKTLTFPMSPIVKNDTMEVLKPKLSDPSGLARAAKELGPAGEAIWNMFKEASDSSDPEQIVKDYPLDWALKAPWDWPNFNEDLLKKACAAPTATLAVDASTMMSWDGNRLLPKSQPWVLMPHQQLAAYHEALAEPAYTKWVVDLYESHGMVVESPGAAVEAQILQRTAQAPRECAHVVYLEACYPDEDAYTIWSWGNRWNMSKTALLGNAYFENTDMMGRNPTKTFTNGLICTAVITQEVTITQE